MNIVSRQTHRRLSRVWFLFRWNAHCWCDWRVLCWWKDLQTWIERDWRRQKHSLTALWWILMMLSMILYWKCSHTSQNFVTQKPIKLIYINSTTMAFYPHSTRSASTDVDDNVQWELNQIVETDLFSNLRSDAFCVETLKRVVTVIMRVLHSQEMKNFILY